LWEQGKETAKPRSLNPSVKWRSVRCCGGGRREKEDICREGGTLRDSLYLIDGTEEGEVGEWGDSSHIEKGENLFYLGNTFSYF